MGMILWNGQGKVFVALGAICSLLGDLINGGWAR